MNLWKRLDSLFVKTSLTLSFSLTLFIILATSFAWFFILSPLSNRAADDMAALITLTSKTWTSLSVQEREAFEKKIALQHDLFFSGHEISTQALNKFYPFIPRLENALKRHTGQQVIIKRETKNETLFWFALHVDKENVNIGFYHDRPGPRPPIALTGVFVAAILVILFTTLLLVRRITHPVKRLSHAVNQFGRGKISTRVPETGPRELASLAKNFNLMAREIAQLMENRAILFGGISHDLRTPITRMLLAVELLDQDQDKALIKNLRNDLVEMEQLIQQSLEFVKGVEKQQVFDVNLDELISHIIDDYLQRNLIIQLKAEPCGMCKINDQVFKRVLLNLLDNAFRYGENDPVTLSICRNKHQLTVQVLDEGLGIPIDKLETVFLPFYRLENSRSKKTGGSGLGLAIVKQLCDAHGWKIELTARENRGVKASVEIPL
jgi:two-component system osmolarity sensor histidine kinase EnvZ